MFSVFVIVSLDKSNSYTLPYGEFCANLESREMICDLPDIHHVSLIAPALIENVQEREKKH